MHTHFHNDHTGGAEFLAVADVPVVADALFIRGEAPVLVNDFEKALHARVSAGLPPAPPVRVDREVRDGDVLDFGGGAHVVSVPGHTEGSIAIYLPTHGVLFTGDIAAG